MKKQYIEKAVTSVLVSLSLASVATAHDDLGETTILATRSDQKLDSVIGSIFSEGSLFYGDKGIYNMSDALDYIPGVTTSRTSGQRGSSQGLLIRGMRTKDVQFRVDGVRVSNRSFAVNSFLGMADVGGFDRIEVLKGAQSALYGGGATSGVVSLSSSTYDEGSDFFAEIGSFDSLRASFRDVGSIGSLRYSIQQSVEYTANDTYSGNSEIPGFDNDFKSYTTALKLDYSINKDLEVGLTYRDYNTTFENPQFGGGVSDSDMVLGSLYAQLQVSDNWNSMVTLSVLDNESFFNPGASLTEYRQYGVAWENGITLDNGSQISFGLEYEDSEYNNGSTDANDDYKAAYANIHKKIGKKVTVHAGARFEDYSSFGSQSTWNTGVQYEVSNKLHLRASAGSSFNPPTHADLYQPLSFGIMGDPNLEPETSESWEISVDYLINDDNQVTLSYFENEVEDFIFSNFGTGLRANNSESERANGIELAYFGRLGDDWEVNFSYTNLSNKLVTGAADQSVKLNVQYAPTDLWSVGATIKYEGDRSFGSELESYYSADLYANYKVSDNVTLTGRIENIGDARYEYYNGFGSSYPARRLGGYLGVKVAW